MSTTHRCNCLCKSSPEPDDSIWHYISPVHIQGHRMYQIISLTVSNACKIHVNSADPTSNSHGSRYSRGSPSLDNPVPPIQRIFDGLGAVTSTPSACGTSMHNTTKPVNNISANDNITSKQAYSSGCFLSLYGHTGSPVAGSTIRHEKVPSRKIGTTAPYISTNVNFNMPKKGSYSTQIYNYGQTTANDHMEQKLSSSDGSGNYLVRYRSYDVKSLHVENNLKRFPISEQTTFDITSNIPQSSFMDTKNRGYAAKSFIAPFSVKPANMGQNSFTSFVNHEYGTMRVQPGHVKQADSFNYELSVAEIPHKTSSEQSRSGHRNSQEGAVSGQEYMKRLLQAHQVVDELLKSRGLIPDDENDYLRNWYQKMNREPKTEERNTMVVSDPVVSKNAGSLNTLEASHQRCTSNVSDSGLSMDADSENDLRSIPKLREPSSRNFMVTDLSPSIKQERAPVTSIKVDIVKAKKHKNVYLKVIIRRPQYCWLCMNVKIRLEKKEVTINSDATRNSKKSCNEGRQMAGDRTEGAKNKNQVNILAKSSENFLTQNKRLDQDHKMKAKTALEQLTLMSNRESNTAKFIERETGKKHNAFLSKPKYETVDVCCCFINKPCCNDKTKISLPITRCATIKQKNITVGGKKFPNKIEKERKLKCNQGNSEHPYLLAKTRKLPFDLSELQNMEKTNKIIVARKKDEIVESKDNMTEIKKDVVDLNKTKKHSKFPIPKKESTKELKAPQESASLFSVSHTNKITSNQARKTSTSGKQVTVSKNFSLQSKLPQLETAMTVPVRLHKIRITKLVMIKQMVNNKKYQHEGLVEADDPSVLRKNECLELKKSLKALQNYTTVTSNYYQEILRPITRTENNTITEFEHNADIDICRAREHLRRINFNRAGIRLEPSTSFVHRINDDPVKLSDTRTTCLGTSSGQSSSISSLVKNKANKKVSEKKLDKDSKDRPTETPPTSTENERYHGGGTTAEWNGDILDRELINAYRRTQRIPKPQAKIPVWNVYDERKQTAGIIRNPPKLRHGTLSTALPIPHFIRTRTPAPIDVAVTLSTPVPATAVLRHVTANHLSVMTPRLKNILSNDSGTTIASSLQQHSPSNQFGVTLKRVDRATIQKSKPRGAITQSAPKKPWVPKWRRIQRTEEEEEVETISVVEVNKKHGIDGDEQEEKQMLTRLSSQICTEKDEKDMTEAEKAMMVAKRRQMEEETVKLQKYEEKRRVEREREEEELRKLKEKKERRKLEREEEERQFQERFEQEEERRKQEEEERKTKIEAEKRKKEDEKRKRQRVLLSQFVNTAAGQTGRNFVIPQKSDKANKFGNIVQAKQEMSMTKVQQEEAKRNYLLSVKRIIEFGKVAPTELREKIRQLHQRICKLEADKYDLEKRHERQEYDLRELNERQRQVARNKALKKGLDPADTNSRHPPKVSIVSKYDRQIDRRNFTERRAMFENKTAYPCFPNVPPPPTVYEKMILSDDKADEPEDGDDEFGEQEEEGDEEEEEG
ncbi:troponin [Loa loa]|uniref:Troponin n=1 Tax=Loa loa TaxID=7209 RepID=A0A1S0TXN3_LOALO|nr:troponin [Loa loa]EFO21854.2 troponin [Loa loa]